MQQLNRRQTEATTYLDGPLLVLAGAGSGKTGVITRKIAYLIEQADMAPHHITAVTFTNKAAREMKARVSNLLHSRNTRGLSISTFHTLGLNILRREHRAAGFKPGFSILDEADTEQLLKDLSHKSDADRDAIKRARWRISEWKNDLVSPEQAVSLADNERELAQAHLYGAFQRAMQAYNAVDFDDLILRPVTLFDEQPEILERWRNRVHHLLVDEYQDTNGAQYRLVRQLVGIRGGLTVVGDDDQSIYAWRGARPENLAQLKSDFPSLKVVKLEQNYRSTGKILRAANELIANNPHVFEKRLWSELGPGDDIRIIPCKDEEHEAERVISEIIHTKFMKKAGDGDFAILYRGNHQAKIFEKVLRSHNLPYFLSGGTAFFSRSEIKDVMGYLRLLANPDDDAAFLRIINTPRREIGPTTLEKLSPYAGSRGLSLLTAIDELGVEQTLSGKPLSRLREFAAWMEQMHRIADNETPEKSIRQLLADIDYEGWLYQTSNSEKAAEARIKNVEELIEWLVRMQNDEMKGDTLAEMIRHLALLDILERQDEESGGERIHLMTLHASKGLEFPHVFLVGMEEGLLPHQSSIDEGDIEEERRLAYVGITRARKTLHITYANKRRRGGELLSCEPSRFLEELPAETISWLGRGGDDNPEEKKQRGTAHLANMKALLGN